MKFHLYQHALIPTSLPHEKDDVNPQILIEEIKKHKAYFARYCTDIQAYMHNSTGGGNHLF